MSQTAAMPPRTRTPTMPIVKALMSKGYAPGALPHTVKK